MNWRNWQVTLPAVLLLLAPLIIMLALADTEFGGKRPARLWHVRPTERTKPSTYQAFQDLDTFDLVGEVSLCLSEPSTNGSSMSNAWIGHVVLEAKAKGDAVDPDTELGPHVGKTVHVITVTMRRPGWAMAPGDTVTLRLVPMNATPAADSVAPEVTRIDEVVIIGVPWTEESETGVLGQVLVGLPDGLNSEGDLIAAEAVAVPSDTVSTPEPTSPAAEVPLELCPVTATPVAPKDQD